MKRIQIGRHSRKWPNRRSLNCYLAILDETIFVIRASSIHWAKTLAENQLGQSVEILPVRQETLLDNLNFTRGITALCEVK